MAGKSKGKAGNKSDKNARQSRQLRWTRIAIGIFGVLLILSMVLSLVQQQNLTK